MFGISSLLTLALATFTVTSPPLVDQMSFEVKNGVNYTVYEHAATGSRLSFVTNSGICETTPGVNQYSGYFSVGHNMNMWFWFFEARNNPSTAPLTLWLTGGPGCSSMVGLFQENGPCTFNNVSGSTPELNPYSWNNYANMLYVDQPVGTGFSYGNESTKSTPEAAQVMWAFMQAFYAHFSDYRNHDFAIVTESYGGHYGPKFAAYFESQNAGIEQGTVSGITIPLIALAINNGLIDPNKQFKALIKYAANNPYRNVINGSEATALYKFYDDSCGPALHNCSSSDTNKACADAANICFTLFDNITKHDFDLYDIRQEFYYSFPPATYVYYLQDSNIQSRIGARVPFQNCSGQVYDEFVHSGDYARSFINSLSEVVQAGIQTVIWAGDADWICNTIGVQEVITDIRFDQSTEFNAAPLKPFTINGVQHGTFKAAGNLSFLIVPGAGHQVAAFKPKTALEVFRQTINKEVLHST